MINEVRFLIDSLEILTERLILLPFTIEICEEVLSGSTSFLADLGFTAVTDGRILRLWILYLEF